MKFVLVECRGDFPPGILKQWRATCAPVDHFFFAATHEAAKSYIRALYPGATFYGD